MRCDGLPCSGSTITGSAQDLSHLPGRALPGQRHQASISGPLTSGIAAVASGQVRPSPPRPRQVTHFPITYVGPEARGAGPAARREQRVRRGGAGPLRRGYARLGPPPRGAPPRRLAACSARHAKVKTTEMENNESTGRAGPAGPTPAAGAHRGAHRTTRTAPHRGVAPARDSGSAGRAPARGGATARGVAGGLTLQRYCAATRCRLVATRLSH